MAIRQKKTSGIDSLMQEIEAQATGQQEVCEDIYKRLWGLCDGVHAALLRAENLRLKAHIDEKDIQRLATFSDSILKAEEPLLERHLEKQKELWHASLTRQRRNLESNEGIWLSRKAFHIWLWLFLLPLCYTIISICYYLAVWFG